MVIKSKVIAMLGLVFLVASCGDTNKDPKKYFKVICIDNVNYLIKDGGNGHQGYMSVKINPDSTVSTCDL